MKLSFGYGAVCSLVLVLQGCGGGGGSEVPASSGNTTGGSSGAVVADVPTNPTTPAPVTSLVSSENTAYLAAVTSIATQQAGIGTQIESFDSVGTMGSAVGGWIYESGAEFPGARGGLTLVAGENSPSLAANLQADLNCGSTVIQAPVANGCGRYVAMTRRLGSLYALATPSTAMVSMSVQATHPLLSTALRVVDGTGQALQFNYVPRTLETNAGASWAKVMVPVGTSSSYWGGANNGQLYNGITSLSLTAGTPILAAPAASVKVDQIRLLESGATQWALSRQSEVLSAGVLPSTAGRFAIASHFYQISDNELSKAKSVGISIVRIDMFWKTAEVGGRFNFSHYDDVLKQLAKHGMSALFILDYGHPDHGVGAPITPADRAAYAEFGRQAALFAKGRNVIAFEVWNEPDNSKYWTNGDPNTYAQALAASRQAIKSADASRKVINGGASWVNLPYILNLAKTGQLNNLDGFAIHPYRPYAPETFASDMEPIKAILKSQGLTTPSIWVTEWGYSSVGTFDQSVYGNGQDPRARARQAVLVLRNVLTQTALNLPLMTIYELSDSGTDGTEGEHNFGLLTQAGAAKPSYNALQTLYSVTNTRSYKGLVKNVPANVHAMRWDSSSDSVFAVWVDSNNVPLTLSVPRSATVTSWSGATIGITNAANGNTAYFKLSEADGPVFVRIPATVTQ